jgi:CheY-like chemotaxis protein
MELSKLLLVDDDSAFNFLNRIILNTNGVNCDIEECLDGKSALDIVASSEKCPEVILLDLNMPVMDGFEFLDEFEKQNKCAGYTNVFILTSSNQEEDHKKALGYKCVKGYFDKPFCEDHIREILAVLKQL